MRYVILITMLLSLGFAFAHPAGKLNATFDQESSLLELDYIHKVKDVMDHHIEVVEIRINDRLTITHQLSLQESKDGGSLIYRLPGLSKGDEISILTKCNKGGNKTAKVTIP
jgi:hypothetical protein